MTRFIPAVLAALLVAGCSGGVAQSVMGVPKFAVDWALEARSGEDIRKDSRIIASLGYTMTDLRIVSVSVEVYEQRVLVAGLLNDKAAHDKLREALRWIYGVKKVYWHVTVMSDDDRAATPEIKSWVETVAVRTKALVRLTLAPSVADLNFRVAADPRGAVYLLGRARSVQERDDALATVREGDGITRVVDYVEVRP